MVDYSYTPLYYLTPVFVRYFDYRAEEYKHGIGYQEELFTHDGAVIPLSTCIIEAQARGIHWDDAIIECDWRDLDSF